MHEYTPEAIADIERTSAEADRAFWTVMRLVATLVFLGIAAVIFIMART
jgi:hypothetical protein